MKRREFIAVAAALLVSPPYSRAQGKRHRLGFLAVGDGSGQAQCGRSCEARPRAKPSRPGGDMTGLSTMVPDNFLEKRLEIIHELVPGSSKIALLTNPDNAKAVLGG